jgi:hypothetical protein
MKTIRVEWDRFSYPWYWRPGWTRRPGRFALRWLALYVVIDTPGEPR